MYIPTLKAKYLAGIDRALNLPWPFNLKVTDEEKKTLQSARDTFEQASDQFMQPFLDNYNKEP